MKISSRNGVDFMIVSIPSPHNVYVINDENVGREQIRAEFIQVNLKTGRTTAFAKETTDEFEVGGFFWSSGWF